MDFTISGSKFTYDRARILLECIRDMAFANLPEDCYCKFLYGEEGANEVGCLIKGGNTRLVPYDEYGVVKNVAVVLPDEYRLSEHADRPADDDEFVEILVSIMHERQHVAQHLIAQAQGTDAYGNLMFITHLSLARNESYYRENYFGLPTEIDAQHHAMQMAYQVLSQLVGPKSAEKYICDYEAGMRRGADDFARNLSAELENGEITQADYDANAWQTGKFVSDPDTEDGKFPNVWVMFDAYLERLRASITEPRSFPERLVKNWDGNAASYFYEHPDVYKSFCSIQCGYIQSSLLANIQYECGCVKYVMRQKEISSLEFDKKQKAKQTRIEMAYERHGLDLSDETTVYRDMRDTSVQGISDSMSESVVVTVKRMVMHDALVTKANMADVIKAYGRICDDVGLD